MRLKEVEIKNFRSIKEITVSFDPTCRVFVGINESGKSNILKALSFLGESIPSKKDDLREALPGEEPILESFIRFIFKFDKPEIDKLFENISNIILTDIKNPEIILIDKNKKTVRDYCNFENEGLYVVDIIDNKKLLNIGNIIVKLYLIGKNQHLFVL